MSDSGLRSTPDDRQDIVGSLTPVRPLPTPARRVWMLVPLGLLAFYHRAPASGTTRRSWRLRPARHLGTHRSPVAAWLVAAGAWSSRSGPWSERVVASPCVRGRPDGGARWRGDGDDKLGQRNHRAPRTRVAGPAECVAWPLAIGAPFTPIATPMAVRAFPTRPAIAGALCGMSAGVLSDAGWRLSCWISEPTHIVGSHGLAMLGLAATGSILAVFTYIWRAGRCIVPAYDNCHLNS